MNITQIKSIANINGRKYDAFANDLVTLYAVVLLVLPFMEQNAAADNMTEIIPAIRNG